MNSNVMKRPCGVIPLSQRIHQGLAAYLARLRAFSPAARLVLLSSFLGGFALGGFRLLLNFYVLSLGEGYNEAFLGTLQTVEALAAILIALPAAYLANRFPQKHILLLVTLLIFGSMLGMVLLPSAGALLALRMLVGVGVATREVTMAPLLMANTRAEERQWVFSMNAGLAMTSMFIGNTISGSLPTLWAGLLGGEPTGALAYQGALATLTVLGGLTLLPLLRLDVHSSHPDRHAPAPWTLLARYGRPLLPFLLPQIIIGLGAGLMQPFMNVYFRNVYGQPDPVIGLVFAFGGISMAVAQLAAPPVADRYGKIETVVLSQAISVPFLLLLGLGAYLVPSGAGAPLFWFWIAAIAYNFRVGLMNMSNPVYQTFVLEQVRDEMRALAVSLSSIAFQFGWFVMPQVSGWLQVHFAPYGFVPIFVSVAALYALAISLQYVFFIRQHRRLAPAASGD